MQELLDRREALTEALVLAVTAPTDEQAAKASDLAERIAADLSPVLVERAKAEAMRRVEDS